MELNREVLDCMKRLRRRLREELAVDIRMSQPDAIDSMLSACLTSTSAETRQQAGHPLLTEDPQARPASGSLRLPVLGQPPNPRLFPAAPDTPRPPCADARSGAR